MEQLGFLRLGQKPVRRGVFHTGIFFRIPDHVHVLSNGRVVKSGGKELALELEKDGYANFTDKAA